MDLHVYCSYYFIIQHGAQLKAEMSSAFYFKGTLKFEYAILYMFRAVGILTYILLQLIVYY